MRLNAGGLGGECRRYLLIRGRLRRTEVFVEESAIPIVRQQTRHASAGWTNNKIE